MNNPFEPVGEKARWRILFEALAVVDVDTVVTYDTLASALDIEPQKERHLIQQAMSRASRELLEKCNRATEVVRGEGYRIVRPEEQLRLAQYRQQRASKELARGSRTVRHVDFNGMEPDTRHAFEVTGRALSAVIDFNRRLDTRQKRLEESVTTISSRQDRSEDEVQQLRARLDNLESRRTSS